MRDERSSLIVEEISKYMPYEEFVRIQERLAELRREEEKKLQALAELQKTYVSANTDSERDYVKQMVGKIRDLSKAERQEIRLLNQEIAKHMTLEQANDFFQRLLQARKA